MRKHYLPLLLALLSSFSTFASIFDNHVDQYIATYKDIAIREMQRSGIPASITLSQGIIESAWGGGELASNSNNHFGIKCKGYWNGPTYYIEDDDLDANGNLIKSCFRAYDDPERSYVDHTDFLVNSQRYQNLFNFAPTDYYNWAKGLKSCGYATDPGYADKLIKMIERYELYQFDVPSENVLATNEPMIASAPVFHIPNKTKVIAPVPQYQSVTPTPVEEVETEFVAETRPRINYDNIPAAVELPADYAPGAMSASVAYTPPVEEEVISVAAPIYRVETTPEPAQVEETYTSPSQPTMAVTPPPARETPYSRESVILASSTQNNRLQQMSRKPRSSQGSGVRF